MKTKQVKYQEAVKRNLAVFFNTMKAKTSEKREQGNKLSYFDKIDEMERIKHRVGIRKTDTDFDHMIFDAINDYY